MSTLSSETQPSQFEPAPEYYMLFVALEIIIPEIRGLALNNEANCCEE